jgi:hypothetical protein
MFDNLTRYFSRRGADKSDIVSGASSIADITEVQEFEPKEYVEQDIDSVTVDAPQLDDLIITEESLFEKEEGALSDDDFQEI